MKKEVTVRFRVDEERAVWIAERLLDQFYGGKEIERRTGVYCDDAIDRGLISKREFEEIVHSILRRKKKRIRERPMVV